MNLQEIFEKDEVIMLNTETIPGFSCRCDNKNALAKIRNLKEKPVDMPLTVLIGSVEQGLELGIFDDLATELTKFWPYATLIVPNKYIHHEDETNHKAKTIGLRMTHIKSLQKDILKNGPIYSTSINKHGNPFAKTETEAKAMFPEINFYNPEDLIESTSLPSVIINLTTNPIKVLRANENIELISIFQKYNKTVNI